MVSSKESVFARREAAFRPSPVRAVFETAMRPDVISLAGGNPDLSFLPHGHLSELAAKLLKDRGEDILQYGSGAGTDGCRELSAALMNWGGADYQLPEIQITSGSQAGLDAVTKLLCDPGDIILAEAPTYVGVLSTFEAYEADLRQIPLDDEGLDPDLVETAILGAKKEGRRIAFLYTIPAYQNPSGALLSPARQEKLIEICARHQVLIVEDDAYGLLGFPTQNEGGFGISPNAQPLPLGAEPLGRPRSLASLNQEGVIHLGSYSKIFSPGSRVGWVAAPQFIRERLQIGCESVCITPSVLAQSLVEAYVGSEAWRGALQAQVAEYGQRAKAAIRAVRELLPEGTSWVEPKGGFFLWLSLPEDWVELVNEKQIDLLDLAIQHQVVIVPGAGCYLDAEPGCHLRIAFSAISPTEIHDGMQRLAAALKSIQVY